MKTFIPYTVFFLIILGCFSCQKKQERISLPVEVWDGQNFHLATDGLPVSIVWFQGSHGSPYKGFCQVTEIQEIVERLQTPEIPGPIPELPLVLGTRNRLCLFYYKGGKYVSRVAVFDFDIDEEGVFLGPRGKSPALGKLLLEKEESGLARYAHSIYPYDEEMIDRAEESARYLQEQEERKRKEVEARPFELVEATLDVFSDPEFDFRCILIRHSDDPDPNHAIALFGELHRARWILGRKINADTILRYPWDMYRIFEGFKEAERVELPSVNEYDVIFLNQRNRKGYLIKMAIDNKYVYGADFRSKQLRTDFAEMGLFEKNLSLLHE